MITSTNNAKIRDARKLYRKRTRQQQGQILVEGVRLIRDAFESGYTPVMVFFAPELLSGNHEGEQLLDELRAGGSDCLACSAQVLTSLAETVTPQGIAAVFPLPCPDLPANPTLLLILDRLRDPGNAGTLARTAEAAGVEMILAAPETVDLFNDKALRAGMGAQFRLPVRSFDNWDEILAFGPPEMTLYVADAGAALHYDAVEWARPSALILGGEAEGPSENARRVAKGIGIPMRGATESLNAASAGAVILFEAARQRRNRDAGRISRRGEGSQLSG